MFYYFLISTALNDLSTDSFINGGELKTKPVTTGQHNKTGIGA
jgi:hypothetical protein